MIDLSVTIRNYLLTIQPFTDIISDYGNSKALFNYRPVPEDAQYPMGIIQIASGGGDTDYLTCPKRTIVYHVLLYSKNEDGNSYKLIERASNIVARSFHRVNPRLLDAQGVNILSVIASNPFPAPTDDNETIARAITLNFEVNY